MGVSEFNLTEFLPDDLKGSMPTVEEIEQEFKDYNEKQFCRPYTQ